MRSAIGLALVGLFALQLAACEETAKSPVTAGIGDHPVLPLPNPTLIPTVNIAPAKRWPPGATPTAVAGLSGRAYANGLDRPRSLYVLPNGDVLVVETNAPPKPEDRTGRDSVYGGVPYP